VYIAKFIIEETEVLLQGRNMNPKKIAKHMLLEIIGEEVIITQTASGGRTYKAADLNILQAVEGIKITNSLNLFTIQLLVPSISYFNN
jgi:hypothetical protein